MGDKSRGIYNKFEVTRTDGKSEPGAKHDGCDYYVLDLTHDKFALPALEAYANACRLEYTDLACDLYLKIAEMEKRFASCAEPQEAHDGP